MIITVDVFWELANAWHPAKYFCKHLNPQKSCFVLFQFYKEVCKLSKIGNFPKGSSDGVHARPRCL